MATDAQTKEPDSLAEAVLGRSLLDDARLKPLQKYPPAARAAAVMGGFAALLFLPYLGAVGLWDPWETHYGEVAREMIQRNDYVHPFWENAWFFSKPVFTMWMQALGMQLTGADIASGSGALGLYTEWGFRLPFALFSILAIVLLTYALARVVSVRAGMATGFVLSTMPLYFLITRQAVTDTPIIAATVCGMACAFVGLFDQETKHRGLWWYAFWGFLAVGTLAKGLLGFGIPLAILFLYALLCVVPWKLSSLDLHFRWAWRVAATPLGTALIAALVAGGLWGAASRFPLSGITPGVIIFFGLGGILMGRAMEKEKTIPTVWNELFRMRLGTGMAFFCLLALPWYHEMFTFESVDDEGKLFWYRFLIHDHFARLSSGVHTTTPGGNFTYFIEQGGYATFPWVLLVPGAFAGVLRLKLRGGTARDQVGVLGAVWLTFTFLLIGASATKFHHYVLSMMLPLALLIGLYLEKLWEDGLAKHAATLLIGVPFFALVGKDLASNPKNFTDLFVYNYDRPYPAFLVQQPIAFWSNRPLWSGDLLMAAALALGAYVSFDAFGARRSTAWKALGVGLLGVGGAALLSVFGSGRPTPMLALGLGLAAPAVLLGLDAMKVQEARYVNGFLALLVGLPAVALLSRGIQVEASRGTAALLADPLLPLAQEPANIKMVLGFAVVVALLVLGAVALSGSRVATFATGIGAVCLFAFWFNWSHWVDLSHHWTQRDQFWVYYSERKPDEPITSFLMNWRGETFYSRNTVKQIKDNNLLYQYASQPGREWALVEHYRFGILKGAVGPDKVVTPRFKDLNNKFVLVTIE